MRIIKKKQQKIPLFLKNIVYIGFFTNEMECERAKQEKAKQVSLYFNTKLPEKRV